MNKNKIIITFIVILIIINVFIYYKKQSESNLIDENIFLAEDNKNNTNTIKSFNNKSISKIKVHIIGEIKSPGLYELDEGSRINDLIILAGGQTENSDLSKVNLAYELSDGEKINIPSIFDDISTYIYNDAGENVLEESNNNFNNEKININTASTTDLEKISGIGPSLAQKIISYRNSNGKFESIDDLKNVSGIGQKKFESIKDSLYIK